MAKPENRWVYASARWVKIRYRALARDQWCCVKCRKRKRIEIARVVDHIIPVEDAPRRVYDLANLQSLCHRCHQSKTLDDFKRKAGEYVHDPCPHGYTRGMIHEITGELICCK